MDMDIVNEVFYQQHLSNILIMLIQKYDSSASVHNANDIQTKGAQSLECLARGPIHLAAGPAQQHPDHQPLTMSLSMTMSLTMS